MSARLEQMSNESLESNPRGAARAVSDAGFSEDLRRQLEERIAGANFRNQHASALAQVEMGNTTPRHARNIAMSQPWQGMESVEDAALRMLTDSHKPMRSSRQSSGQPFRMPQTVDTGRAKHKPGIASVIARAKENTATYEKIKDSPVSKEEREKMLAEMRAKFHPHARSVVPGTIQGLASLANERIEDAIARGQFKNLPRGQVIERDYTASSPFLDTTEYFMNKIIQKQEIVPPWIEKQQELVSAAAKFRARLRNDWKRHAARTIASKGGTLEEQIRRAQLYAEAELRENPSSRVKEERMNTISAEGHISQISPSSELHVPDAPSLTPFPTANVIDEEILVTTDAVTADSTPAPITSPDTAATLPTSPPTVHPFRDPSWLSTEQAYLTHAIASLNALTRTYNLQAPRVAQKPYFHLERELRACYTDVAPQLAPEIRMRALAPRARSSVISDGGVRGGLLDRVVGTGAAVRVRDEEGGKRYGMRQFWRDLWGGGTG
ncbi:hypothetical protein EJ05DRAFT_494350 [Pseudovirgaria hyperparasitica]|uniref:DnaJ homologue subfamily C member 28 conserved domain-containing protein n=1 Tax=Pseudovirgaria hyperparasitica TaxID=470096 RepID=A0A6A6W1F3_9PEZI|nr:uncharacterized protein EJ05DRAFT_494350 [Pseudovirgaria hyperparasitica]KAF2754881.1 hypothetical protein EJ05DRAFT_494350 [Pseudovirgaria hyperparasitica]